MKRTNLILIAGCVALSLVGCTSIPTSQISLKNVSVPGDQVARGHLNLTIRWPGLKKAGYSTQGLPGKSQAIVLVLKQGGAQVQQSVLKRSQANYATSVDGNGVAITNFRLDLAPGDGYTLEARIFDTETDADMGDAHQIASGLSQPFSIQSGLMTPVEMPVQVPNGPMIDPLIFGASGRNGTITLSGSHFGTDASLIKAIFVPSAYGGQFPLDVIQASDGQLTLKLNGNMATGAGKIKVYVDGVGANQVDFTVVDDINVDTSGILANTTYANNASLTTLYVLKDATFSVPLTGMVYGASQTSVASVSATVTAKDKSGADYPLTVVNGAFSLPQGYYDLTFSSGDLKKTFACESMALQFNAPSISTVKISKLMISGYQQQSDVTLPGMLVGNGQNKAQQVYLRGTDFQWAYSVPGVTQRQGEGTSDNWADQQAKATFLTGMNLGTTHVTATLKFDPTKTFGFDVANVGPDGLVASPAAASLRAADVATLSLQVHLSDGTLLDPTTLDSSWNGKFEWSSSDPNVATVVRRPQSNTWSSAENGFGLVTGVGLGTTTINVKLTDNDAASLSIPVTVTDDGRLNLTID